MNFQRLGEIAPTPDDLAWYDVIGKFKRYVNDFMQQYNTLQNTHIDSVKYPELSKTQIELLKRGTGIKGQIQSITGAIDSAWGWLKDTFGFDGVRDMDRQMGSMGIPVLIPIAVVVAAITAITKWGLDYTKFYQKLQYAKKLQQDGYAPTQINEMVSTVGKGTSLFDFGTLGPIAFIGVAGVLGYMVLKK